MLRNPQLPTPLIHDEAVSIYENWKDRLQMEQAELRQNATGQAKKR